MTCVCQRIIYRSSVALNSLAQIVRQHLFDLTLERLSLIPKNRRRCVRDPNNSPRSTRSDLFRGVAPPMRGGNFNLHHDRATRRRPSR
jgi:hypothetical protein